MDGRTQCGPYCNAQQTQLLPTGKASSDRQAGAAALAWLPTCRFHKEKPMKHSLFTSACLLSAALALGGCASNPSNAQIGTGVGAVAGGVVGEAVFGGTLGTIGGAAAGALIGNEVGKNNDNNRRR
jgi:osmotically inducible lipoprotein OsmB